MFSEIENETLNSSSMYSNLKPEKILPQPFVQVHMHFGGIFEGMSMDGLVSAADVRDVEY